MAHSAHFSDAELACPCCGVNGCTQELVDSLEALRLLNGGPVNLTSAYRCPSHNAAIHGAKDSAHMKGEAADFHIRGKSVAEMEALARRVYTFRGIGRNDHLGFVHADTRKKPAQWCYGPNGQQCTYYKAAA